MSFGINVLEFGAKGDGVTDDTKSIQDAINYASKRGGGRILFPYSPKGYRIASSGIEEYNGRKVRAQLIIPPENQANIFLEGEMPCRLLNSYQVRPLDCSEIFKPTRFGTIRNDNTFLFSDWEAPEIHDANERPWSMLAAPEGDSCKGKFSVSKFSISNLEFRVKLNKDKMYPTQSAVNLQNVSRAWVSDCQFCLDDNIGDTVLGKELVENPCHTAGLIMSGDQNDHNVIRSVGVQGFKYGLVLGEHVVADYLYVHNCEEGVVFHDCSHLSVIEHIVAQHNRCIVTTTRENLFGMEKGPCNVIIGSINYEGGQSCKPAINRLAYGIYDVDKRLHGSAVYHEPWGKQEFPFVTSENFIVKRF